MSQIQDIPRLWERVVKTDTCWLWHGTTNEGYGMILIGGRWRRAHRIAYEIKVGEIPSGLVLDHLCRVRNCVNPSHLEPVTVKENVLRGFGAAATYSRRSHCMHGHEFNSENTKVGRTPRGTPYRRCRECDRIRGRAAKARARANRNAKKAGNNA